MARMKALFTAMTDPDNCLGDEALDDSRMQAWHDAIRGVYMPELYAGDHKRAYRLGRQQLEVFCVEEGIDLFGEPKTGSVKLEPTLEQELMDPHNEWGTWEKNYEWEKVDG